MEYRDRLKQMVLYNKLGYILNYIAAGLLFLAVIVIAYLINQFVDIIGIINGDITGINGESVVAGYQLLGDLMGETLLAFSGILFWVLAILLAIDVVLHLASAIFGSIWHKKYADAARPFMLECKFGKTNLIIQTILNGLILLGVLFTLFDNFDATLLIPLAIDGFLTYCHIKCLLLIEKE